MTGHPDTKTYTVFYHHPCFDGSTAAWAVRKKLGDGARYVGLDHADYDSIIDTIKTNVTPNTIAIFVDFAPRAEILREVIDCVKSVEIYDHHVTSEKDLVHFEDHPKCKIVFDMERSGAGIAYDEFVGGERPIFVRFIENLDLYKPDRFDTMDQFFDVASFITNIDVEEPFEQVMAQIDRLCKVQDASFFSKEGRPYRYAYLKKINAVMDKISFANLVFLKNGQGLSEVPLVHANLHDLGHEFTPKLLAQCPHDHGAAGMVWAYHNDDVIKVSFRSDGRVDVSLIAEELGRDHGQNGGGHKGAASVRFTVEQFAALSKKAGFEFNV